MRRWFRVFVLLLMMLPPVFGHLAMAGEAPVVTAPQNIVKEATGPLTEVTLGQAIAMDDIDGELSVEADDVGPFSVGEHVVTWSATDSEGKTGIAQQLVRITDTTPPQVLQPQKLELYSDGTSVFLTSEQARAVDFVDGELTATPDRRGPFDVGEHTVTWSARDRAGNVGTAQQQISVRAVDAEDRTLPEVMPPPDITAEAIGPLTSVVLGVATAIDQIDGELVATTDDKGPFEVGTHRIVWKATNSAGKTGLGIQTVTIVDSQEPFLRIPSNRRTINISSRGARTAITDFGVLAEDAVDGELEVSGVLREIIAGSPIEEARDIKSDEAALLSPGKYEVIWTAVDKSRNEATTLQNIEITPSVGFLPDQRASAGETVTVGVKLNGRATTYPVKVPYRVDPASTAVGGGLDHNARDGVIVINSGVDGSFQFKVADEPNFSGSGEAEIIFSMGSPENAQAGPANTHRVILTTDNRRPEVDIVMLQGGAPVTTAVNQGGVVTITAVAHDPEGDDLSYDWGRSDNALGDLNIDNNPATLEIDPFSLRAGNYSIRVTVTDSGIPAKQTTVKTLLVVTNGSEVIPDRDSDGIADAKDKLEESNLLQGNDKNSDAYLLSGEPGVALRLGAHARKARGGSARLRSSRLPNTPGNRVVATIYDFEIHGLMSGQSSRIVLPQATRLPYDGAYFVYGRRWAAFQEDDLNKIYSAPTDFEGVCPLPGSDDYQEGLKAGDRCVQLLIQDGGPNDTDNEANGVIVNPGAVMTGGKPAVLADDGDGDANVLIVGVNKNKSSGGGALSAYLLLFLGLFRLCWLCCRCELVEPLCSKGDGSNKRFFLQDIIQWRIWNYLIAGVAAMTKAVKQKIPMRSVASV